MTENRETGRNLDARIGAQIRSFRKAKGFTQAQLAELSGVDNMTISRLETGSRMPTIEHLLRLASVLEVTASRLLGEGIDEVSNEAVALADAMKDMSDDQKKFVFELILLYKNNHQKIDSLSKC